MQRERQCLSCHKNLKAGDHEFCHLTFSEIKTYRQYQIEASSHYASILNHYGMPPGAQVPNPEPYHDELFVKMSFADRL